MGLFRVTYDQILAEYQKLVAQNIPDSPKKLSPVVLTVTNTSSKDAWGVRIKDWRKKLVELRDHAMDYLEKRGFKDDEVDKCTQIIKFCNSRLEVVNEAIREYSY